MQTDGCEIVSAGDALASNFLAKGDLFVFYNVPSPFAKAQGSGPSGS